MIRSRFGRAVSTVPCSSIALPVFAERALEAARSASRAIAGLATVPPRNHDTERDMKAAKTQRQKHVSPFWGRKQRKCPHEHKTQPHDRHDAHRECTTRYYCGSIKQQPNSGSDTENLQPIKNGGENGAGNQRRHEAQQSATCGPGLQR